MNSQNPAFPIGREFNGDDFEQFKQFFGLTKREYIAALTLQAFIMNPQWRLDAKTATEAAIEYTDELLEQLDQENKKD